MLDDALKIFAKNLLDSGKQLIICGDFNVLRGDIKAFYANVQHDWFIKNIIMDKEIWIAFESRI